MTNAVAIPSTSTTSNFSEDNLPIEGMSFYEKQIFFQHFVYTENSSSLKRIFERHVRRFQTLTTADFRTVRYHC